MSHIEFLDPDDKGDTQEDQPFGSERLEAPGEPESPDSQPASTPADEPLASLSAWRRVVTHKVFVSSAITLGGLAVGGVVLLATRSLGPTPQVLSMIAVHRRELTAGVVEKAAGGMTRTSPVEHMVHAHQRLQHYGARGLQTKLVDVAPYARGVTA